MNLSFEYSFKGTFWEARFYDLIQAFEEGLVLGMRESGREAEISCGALILRGTSLQFGRLLLFLRDLPLPLAELSTVIEAALQKAIPSPSPSFFRKKEFRWGERTYLMGIVNLTPDSFSGDGLASKKTEAIDYAYELVEAGADIIDVGGESTRPGHSPIETEDEWERLEDFLKEFVPNSPVPVSLDTSKASVALRGLELGVDIINDIWGLKREREIARLAKRAGAGLILMQNRAEIAYTSFLLEVYDDMRNSVGLALSEGIPPGRIIIDPGFGFGKFVEHNYQLLANLESFRPLGFPLLVGVSRKSFIGKLTGKPPQKRAIGTAAAVSLAVSKGADVVRVHDVEEMREAILLCDRVLRKTG